MLVLKQTNETLIKMRFATSSTVDYFLLKVFYRIQSLKIKMIFTFFLQSHLQKHISIRMTNFFQISILIQFFFEFILIFQI